MHSMNSIKSPHWHFKPFSYTQTDSLLTTGVRTRFTIDKILIILFKSTAVTIRLLAKWFWKWFWSTHFYLSSFLNPSMVTSVLDRSYGKKFYSKDQNLNSFKNFGSFLSLKFHQNRVFDNNGQIFQVNCIRWIVLSNGCYRGSCIANIRFEMKWTVWIMVWLEIATKVITTIQNNQKQGAYWSFKFTLFDRLVVTIPWVMSPFYHYYEFPFWHTC